MTVMLDGHCVHMQGATHFNSFRYPTHTNLHAHGMKLVLVHLSPMAGKTKQCKNERGEFSKEETLALVVLDES